MFYPGKFSIEWVTELKKIHPMVCHTLEEEYTENQFSWEKMHLFGEVIKLREDIDS